MKNETLKIGCHISASDGYFSMGKKAASLGANVFAFFTRNPRGGKAKPIDQNDIKKFLDFCQINAIVPPVAHSPYTLNPCSDRKDIRDFAFRTMQDDLERLKFIPNSFYNFHPGSHMNQGAEAGINFCAELLNQVLQEGQSTIVLIETMAGKGSQIGKTFEEVKAIYDLVSPEKQQYVGVCLDTCHIWDAGYDIVNHFDDVFQHFDEVIGLEKLKAIHLNDSMNPLGSKKDRHARIGEGHIGKETLLRVVHHEKLKNLSFILETPNDDAGYRKEIDMIRNS